MNRPPCYYCSGTGWLDDAERIDVDDYRGADCWCCEGTGVALHSANTDTRYRFRDPLLAMRTYRRYARIGAVDNGFDPYLNAKRRAIGAPVLRQLRMAEAAIGCTNACNNAIEAWRNVA